MTMRTEPAVKTEVARPQPLALARPEIARDALLLLPLFLGLFVGIWHPIQDLNEGLYARIPQEMLAAGNWVIPTLNGVPYLEKPPLLYWITAGAYALFGVHEWTARCGSILGMALGIAAMWRYARAAFSRDTALYAVWIYATLPIAIVLGRTLLFDALFTGLLAWALVLLHEHWRDPRSTSVLRWSYACLALAVMTKGLAALAIYVGVALAYAWSCRSRIAGQQLRLLLEPGALAAFVVIAAPWHVAAALQEPGFAWFYFINEHVMRLLGTRVPHDYHTGPWWYHLPRVAVYTLPWALLALVRVPRDVERERTRDGRMFLWSWLLVPLAVFSLAGEKGEYYMMLGMPALALLLAQHAMALKRTALLLVPLGLVGALVWAQTTLMPHIAPYRLPEHYTTLLFAACVMTVASIAAYVRGGRRTGLLAVGAAGFTVMALFSGFMAVNADFKSARNLAAQIALHPEAQVYLYEDYETVSSLPFYLNENVGVVNSRSSDLWFGMQLHPDPERFPDTASFAARAQRSDLWLIVNEKRLTDFRRSALAPLFATTGHSGRHVLLRSVPHANRQSPRGAPR